MRPAEKDPAEKVYRIRRTPEPPSFSGTWSEGVWADVPPLQVDRFHAASSDHRPKTEVKVLYDSAHLYLFFRVQDRYVRAIAEDFQGPVWEDSCVEAFLRPREDKGYFNFEMNCGGTLLLYYIEDPRRTDAGFAKFTPVAAEQVAGMRIYHSLPARVEAEIADPVEWFLEYSIPLSIFEVYIGEPIGPLNVGAGRRRSPQGPQDRERPRSWQAPTSWRGNFYKCGDKTSHPHWASWTPIGEELNFHCPEHFGVLEFGES